MRNEEIAAAWRTTAVSDYRWVKSENQAGAVEGEATGQYVTADGFPRRAYCKPITAKADDGDYCRAAREKIAADLAHDLGLPVPPAQLITWDGRPAVVSLVMYPRQWPWEQVQNLDLTIPSPLNLVMNKELSRATPMLVFDTWLDQKDHGDYNPHNIILGYSPDARSEAAFIFLDYAYSTGFDGSWDEGKWSTVKPAHFPRLILERLDAGLIESTICAVEDLAEERICKVVGRIGDAWMPARQRAIVQEGLLGRRKIIRDSLSMVPK